MLKSEIILSRRRQDLLDHVQRQEYSVADPWLRQGVGNFDLQLQGGSKKAAAIQDVKQEASAAAGTINVICRFVLLLVRLFFPEPSKHPTWHRCKFGMCYAFRQQQRPGDRTRATEGSGEVREAGCVLLEDDRDGQEGGGRGFAAR